MTSAFALLFASRKKRAERKRVQAISAFLDHLEQHPFKVATLRDPRKKHAHYDLERVVGNAETCDEHAGHPALGDLCRLIHKPPAYRAVIDILSVTGVSATHNNFVGNLDALPETMRFSDPYEENYGPFDQDGMEKLRQAVFDEFSPGTGSKTGLFSITDVTWSGKRIAGNTGASRRFSLWRRLSARNYKPERIHALIHPLELNKDALRKVLTDWRVVHVSRSPEIVSSYRAMRDVWPEGICALDYQTSWGDRREEDWIIPLPHQVPLEVQRRFAALHARLDLDGIEDPLREVCEAISLAQRSSVRSKPDIATEPDYKATAVPPSIVPTLNAGA
ncbi:hypothetical protein HLH34_18785 [Gluconacetobacter azotocaptans]|uniref:Uncharacterized protein n=1 Tax=Gluconacetobacter azotocaptans TaxID=142834 RepID=A0A7W4JW44_9PROT|nr:hypothetical protein [Gluconacetobacter azotocaptans]MBB2191980.1 hypothetical protein [Gluconacetobacter azotocaptans]GBQ31941.1 hypothetical protein AA13594_2232 [Gluconacetobacter azotocaptans DSM 13594]